MIMRNGEPNLRQQLELRTRQIERTLGRASGGAGGRPGADAYRPLAAGWSWLSDLKSDLVASLGATGERLQRPAGQPRLFGRQSGPAPVSLLQLIGSLPQLTRQTAVLGLDQEDRPLLLNLNGADVTNILIAGGSAAGKSELLRTIALSLALSNRQSSIQLVIFDGPREGERPFSGRLYSLSYLPHMMSPIVESVIEAAETLRFLSNEVAYRQEQSITEPLIVGLLDNVDELAVEGGGPIQELLVYLLQEGPAAGIRLVMAARNPAVPELRPLLVGNVAIRLVGRVTDSRQAQVAAGQPDSQAEYLAGKGDFLAVAGGSVVPFQAAYVSDYDLHLSLEELHSRSRRATVLARPLTAPELTEYELEPLDMEMPFDSGPSTPRIEFSPEVGSVSEPQSTSESRPTAPGPVRNDETKIEREATTSESGFEAAGATESNLERAAVREKSAAVQSWSDAYFDFLNSANFDQSAPLTAPTSEPPTSDDTEVMADLPAVGQDGLDDFWHNEEYWSEVAGRTPTAPEPTIPAPEAAAELIYEDLDDEIGLSAPEDEGPVVTRLDDEVD